MLVERPEIAVFEKERMSFFELFQKHHRSFRKSDRQVLVIRFEKITERYSHLAYLQLFAVFLHYRQQYHESSGKSIFCKNTRLFLL